MDIILLLVFCFLIIFVINANRSAYRNTLHLKRLERKIDFLLEHLNVDYQSNFLKLVKSHLLKKEKIKAIKVFRQLNPEVSLLQAKKIVDKLEEELHQSV
jgi:hypothetical protein